MADDRTRILAVEERTSVPLLGLLFGGAAMLPFPVLAAAVWLDPLGWSQEVTHLEVLWGSAILTFLAGVRRGLSFRTPGGERLAQIVTMLLLFVLGFAALVSPWDVTALGALTLGYVALAALDPAAARRQEAPLFFARLRPVQMAIPVASLALTAMHAAMS